ncbi:class I SAM-dependent methyltransferase family protein [Candidatus Woesearchaeota archaeon]|nr:class I SAM-dependent methyltransferase family protein [Candidatus Woesearchaeota archaeon]
MVKVLKISKIGGEKVRKKLIEKGVLDASYSLGKTGNFLLFPLKKTRGIVKEFGGKIVDRPLRKVSKPVTGLKEALGKILPSSLAEKFPRSFDQVGDIAVLEIPQGLGKYEKVIARTLGRINPRIKVVAKRAEKYSGKYRIRPITVLYGEKRSETIHREAGVRLKVDLNTVYFSPRLGKERLRIAKLVEEKEKVLVMFSGIAPYGIVIAKKNPSAEVWNIEWNPHAVKFAEENIKLNKLGKRVHSLGGDVRKVIPKLKKKFDRIVMVLPFDNDKFLVDGLMVSKKGKTVIHMYSILEEGAVDEFRSKLERKHGLKVFDVVKAGAYGPKMWRYCFEIIV